jgi:hypothetical protein
LPDKRELASAHYAKVVTFIFIALCKLHMRKLTRTIAPLTALSLALLSQSALSIEGLWPLHDIPFAHIEKQLGVKLDQTWIDRARAAAGRYGSSSGFVSPTGLIATNHHVAEGCLSRLSSAQDNVRQNGFLARSLAEERVCPGAQVRVLDGKSSRGQRRGAAQTDHRSA